LNSWRQEQRRTGAAATVGRGRQHWCRGKLSGMARGSAQFGHEASCARTVAGTLRRRLHPGSGLSIQDGERCL